MRTLLLAAAAAATPALAAAQSELSPAKEDMAAAPKIYSPCVERTVRQRDFVWGDCMLEGEPIGGRKMRIDVWDRRIRAAEHHNEPGAFIALIGFERTSLNSGEAASN